MKLPEATQAQIDLFLCGELTGTALQQFEERCAADASFKQEVERQEGLLDRLVADGAIEHFDVQNRIKLIHDKVVKQDKPKRSSLINMRWVAAAAAVLLITAFAYLLMDGPQSNAELFAAYGQSPRVSLIDKGSSAQALAEAEADFNGGRYEAALTHFAPYVMEHPDDYLILLYKGICHLNLDQFGAAKRDFDLVSNSKAIFASMGDWYWALGLLKQGNRAACISELEQLLQRSDFSKHREAKDLLKALK